MEVFLEELVDGLAARGVRNAILVHDHEPARRGGRDAGPAPEGGSGSQSLTRAPILGTVAFAPISPAFPLLLRRLCRTFEPQVIHFHMPNLSAFWALALPCCRRVRWVVHWHSDVVASRHNWKLRLLYPLYRPFEQRLLRRADAVVATSREYLESSDALAKWRHKCHVIPLGLDAMVNYGSIDMRWRNSLEHPVLVLGRVDGSTLTFKIIGSKSDRAEVKIERANVGLIGPSEKEIKDPDLEEGKRVRICRKCGQGVAPEE